MGGKSSRDKGNRGERSLAAFLNKHGFTDARRIPLSGAMQGFKGDVEAMYGNRKYTFELKCRANSFKTFYEYFVPPLQYGEVIELREEITHESLCILSPYPPRNIIDVALYVTPAVAKRIKKMKTDWLKGEDVLVLKDDRKRFLFLEFYPYVLSRW